MKKLRINKLHIKKPTVIATDTLSNTRQKKRAKTDGLLTLPNMTSQEPCLRSVANGCTTHSIHNQFDQSMQRKSNVLSISPRMLTRWVTRKMSLQSDRAHIYFPTSTCGPFDLTRYVVDLSPRFFP